MTKEEAIESLKKLMNKIETQDRRATAHPVQFLLQVRREYVAHDEYNHNTETVYRHHDMEGSSYKTIEEVEQWLKDYGYEGKELEKEIDNIEKFEMGHYWETTQAFLTEDGVQRHLELNKHNLREHRDYVVHSFRNPELKELFDAIKAVIA